MGPTTWYLDLLLGVLTLAGFMDGLGGARRAEKLRELRRCVQEAVGFKKSDTCLIAHQIVALAVDIHQLRHR